MATFFNQATLRFGNSTVSSNIVTGEVVEVLSAAKYAVNTDYTRGGTVTYIVSLFNVGALGYEGLTVSDDLGAYTVEGGETVTPLDYESGTARLFLNGTLQENPTVTGTAPLTVEGIAIPAGSNVQLIYQARVNDYAPIAIGDGIENTVTVSGGNYGGELTAVSFVPAGIEPVVSVAKSISPSSVTENSRVTYSFVMENRGNTEAGTDTVLTDVFDPVLSDLTVLYNGIAWTEGVQYDYVGGTFATRPGAIVIPAAAITRDPVTGLTTIVPGTCALTVIGTIGPVS